MGLSGLNFWRDLISGQLEENQVQTVVENNIGAPEVNGQKLCQRTLRMEKR